MVLIRVVECIVFLFLDQFSHMQLLSTILRFSLRVSGAESCSGQAPPRFDSAGLPALTSGSAGDIPTDAAYTDDGHTRNSPVSVHISVHSCALLGANLQSSRSKDQGCRRCLGRPLHTKPGDVSAVAAEFHAKSTCTIYLAPSDIVDSMGLTSKSYGTALHR